MEEKITESKRETGISIFDGIFKMAKDAGALKQMEAIMDYQTADHFNEEAKIPITNHLFNVRFEVDFGCSEGIYIDAYIVGEIDEADGDRRIHIGLIKTLENDLNAMRIMGEACGVLQFYAREYLAQKLDNLLPDYSKFFIFHEKHRIHVCNYCKNFGTVDVLEIPHPEPSENRKKKFSLRCRVCGTGTHYESSSLPLIRAWNKGDSYIFPNGTILVQQSELQKICALKDKIKCDLNCAKCPGKGIRELRRITHIKE